MRQTRENEAKLQSIDQLRDWFDEISVDGLSRPRKNIIRERIVSCVDEIKMDYGLLAREMETIDEDTLTKNQEKYPYLTQLNVIRDYEIN